MRSSPTLRRLSQNPADEREAGAAAGQECGCGAHIGHRQCFVDGTGKVGVGAVGGHAERVIQALTRDPEDDQFAFRKTVMDDRYS